MSAIVASKRLSASLKILSGGTKPVDGTSGTGKGQAPPGTLYVMTGTNPRLFMNRGTKASPTWEPCTKMVTVVVAGRNGAGAITATGFKVGDKVVAATNLTDGTGDGASFETEITVADQIQQSSASNLTTKKYVFQVQR
jgi:hypothetical protein